MGAITRGYYIDYNALQKQQQKNWNSKLLKWKSWKVKCASDQRSFGFRVGHCHVQLSGVNIYIKLQSTPKGERKIKGAKSRTLLRFYIKTIEMTIGCGQRNQLGI